MERIFRVQENHATSFAVERDGELRRGSGDVFGSLSVGGAIPGGLGAVRALSGWDRAVTAVAVMVKESSPDRPQGVPR